MLNKRIKTTGMEITEAISEYVHKKVDVLEKFIDSENVGLAEIEIGRTSHHHHKGDVYKAEMNFTYEKVSLNAIAIDSDLYRAIDIMRDNIVHEFKKAKQKKNSKGRKEQQKIKGNLKRMRE
ncbi:MAG: ribosome-associated translation inhibitor RaiA [Patescibacteria group bacterium]